MEKGAVEDVELGEMIVWWMVAGGWTVLGQTYQSSAGLLLKIIYQHVKHDGYGSV